MNGLLVSFGLASAVGFGLAAGCGNAENDCHRNGECTVSSAVGTGGGATGPGGGSATGGDGGGGDGGGGGSSVDCVPSELASGAVNPSCGVFVSSSLGSASGDGTQEEPFKSLENALTQAGGAPVYACAETFTEALVVAESVTLYGGLDCANGWVYAGADKKTTWTAGADKIPLTLTGSATGTVIEDFTIQAADAEAVGGSSMAVMADGVAVELTRCDLIAGNGAAGNKGMAFPAPAQAGAPGNVGTVACSGDMIFGGAAVVNDCPGGMQSIGGDGGIGTQATGGTGTAGAPLGSTNNGVGEVGVTSCTPGTKGDDGAPGASGAGAFGTGTLDLSGFVGVIGTDGALGFVAQGGGGGGGAKGGTAANQCPNQVGMKGGASGGSGGAGGCGGAGGRGGTPGGASIALVSLNATFAFADVTLTAGNGGDGGQGGDGQQGGGPGLGGLGGTAPNGLNPACSGGQGGTGGQGGKGGGGLGGHSLALAFVGSAPAMEGATSVIGVGGLGGVGGDLQGNGADGVATETLGF